MPEKHIPIDSKDDDADYRAQVWDAVQRRVGSRLTPLLQDATFEGTWDVEFDLFGSRHPMFRYEFQDRGTVTITTLMGNDQSPNTDRYAVRGEGRMSISGATYHAAKTQDDKLVLFNGDQSLVMIATKR